MAKAKAAEQAVLPPLVITPEKGMPVDGNFQQILGYLKLREKEVAKMGLSEDNIEQAKLVKKEAGAYRKAVEERLKTTIALLFDGPKDVLKSKAQELFNAIGRIESAAEKALDKVEEDRVADLDRAFDAYQESFQAVYQLDDQRRSLIEKRKWYYNKTPPGNEKKAKDDMELQFQDLKNEQDRHESDVKMVRALCADEPRLNVQTWIDRLKSVPVSFIAEELVMEKERLAELDKPAASEPPEPEPEPDEDEYEDEDEGYGPAAAQGPILRVSILDRIAAFEDDLPGRTAKKGIELEYPCAMGDLITELFVELRRSKVVARALKEEAVF
jgi:hypothetical protein